LHLVSVPFSRSPRIFVKRPRIDITRDRHYYHAERDGTVAGITLRGKIKLAFQYASPSSPPFKKFRSSSGFILARGVLCGRLSDLRPDRDPIGEVELWTRVDIDVELWRSKRKLRSGLVGPFDDSR
jgi:hypothetical protein